MSTWRLPSASSALPKRSSQRLPAARPCPSPKRAMCQPCCCRPLRTACTPYPSPGWRRLIPDAAARPGLQEELRGVETKVQELLYVMKQVPKEGEAAAADELLP